MIWLNGDIRPSEGALSANDRGLLLGESVFETILLAEGRAQFWPQHIARLFEACDALGFERPHDAPALKDALVALQSHHGQKARQVLRLTVTGGTTGRGLVPQNGGAATWLMQISDAAAAPAYLRLVDSDTPRLAGNPSHLYKTGAYLDNILARRAAVAAGADEALLFNQHGRLACAAAGNVFVQQGRRLITPPVSEGALPGIIRGAFLHAASLAGLQIVEGLVGRDLLAKADGLYVSNSVQLIVPAGYDAGPAAAQKKQGHALREALSELS